MLLNHEIDEFAASTDLRNGRQSGVIACLGYLDEACKRTRLDKYGQSYISLHKNKASVTSIRVDS